MQIPVKITTRDMPPSPALETHIREKAQKLGQFARNIISCRVVIEMPHRHHHQGRQFNVRIGLCVPGHEIVVNRDRHEDVYVALREAFDAIKRQLEDREQRLRREIKNHAPEYHGCIDELNPIAGYGFIVRHADQSRLYFRRDNVVTPQFERLRAGDEVRFIEEPGASRAQAKRVSAGKHHVF
jgi:ribosomal subunit interface protein